jgi:hypothetical protein
MACDKSHVLFGVWGVFWVFCYVRKAPKYALFYVFIIIIKFLMYFMKSNIYGNTTSFADVLKLTFIIVALLFSNVSFVFADTDGDIGRTFITNVRVENVDSPAGTANILWDTDLPVQSLVVCGTYAASPYFYARDKENFGYEWKTKLMKGLVTKHKVPLDGLTKGVHHCRVASRLGDNTEWVVSEEITFNVGVGDVKSVNPILTKQANSDKDVSSDSVSLDENNTDLSDNSDNDEDGKSVENKGNVGISTSLGSIFAAGACNDKWSVWVLILMALLLAVVWPKELLDSLSPEKTVKRLYVLSIVGVLTFFVAVAKSSNSWILPVGIATVAFILATITDVLRKGKSTANSRLMAVVRTLMIVFAVGVAFAIVLGWSCSILPMLIAVFGLAVRYTLHKRKK